MNEERRRLLLARDTWRSAYPNEMEVVRAAKRIASRFQPGKAFSFGRRIRMVSGALATVAGIAYAGSGAWSDVAGWIGRGGHARPVTEEQVQPLARPTKGPHDPKEDRVGVVPERLAVDSPVPDATDATVKPAKRKSAHTPVVRTRRAAAAESRDIVKSAARVDPTWTDVNSALGTLDYRRAETLLLQLSGSHDADTRAKAHLGLAQLAASRGDCERARVLALGVAAVPGIEMKTVRRALELAVRCAR
jgi:hypothetical protein